MLQFFAILALAQPATAPAPLRFEWKAGDVLKYRVVHDTTITETLPNSPARTTTTKLTLAKTWTVLSVEPDNSAALALTITALRQEILRGNEEPLVIDSSTPDGAKAMAEYLNKPILTAKLSTRGSVLDVKATTPDAAKRLQAELPFRIELPDQGQTWERPFAIQLDPPVGTGEKYEAVQSCRVEPGVASPMVVTVSTSLKAPPKEVAEMQPLLPWLWEGTVMFDPVLKRYLGAKLSVRREYPNHQGAGSKFVFESTLTETIEK